MKVRSTNDIKVAVLVYVYMVQATKTVRVLLSRMQNAQAAFLLIMTS